MCYDVARRLKKNTSKKKNLSVSFIGLTKNDPREILFQGIKLGTNIFAGAAPTGREIHNYFGPTLSNQSLEL